MSAIPKVDQDQLVHEAVASILAEHIRVRVESQRSVLVTGTPKTTAEKILHPWSPARKLVFYKLSKSVNQFHAKSALAGDVRWSQSSLDSFWKSLHKYKVRVRPRDGLDTGETSIRLFRRGKERRFKGDGIGLYLGLAQPAFSIAKEITSDTYEATIAHRDNYEGACIAQESDGARDESERTEARRRLSDDADSQVVEGPQLALASAANDRRG